ncbi:MAG: serine protease [Brachymonas sp.]|nr:serine protease [Brachymonas sp.]
MFFRTTVLVVSLLASAFQAVAQQSNRPQPARTAQIERSVVKIYTTARQPDMYRPWSKAAASESTGSGVVIEGNRILTNAHVVNYASKVEVQSREGGDKFAANVVAVARGIDLAVLELEDASFFKDRPPIKRDAGLPEVKDSVLAYGYPVGGNSLSITKGIVSRIEFTSYSFPTAGLRIQIDAAINPGNSGGPVFAEDKMIGLAFSIISNSQNIGYIIPNEEINLFIQDIADGKYDGKPKMFDELQTLENPALRKLLKLDSMVRGMVVKEPASKSANYPLKEWDVISRIGGVDINNQGLVALTPDLNVQFQVHVQRATRNGKLPLTVVRDGKAQEIELPVSANRARLVSGLGGAYPSYFIYGPIVFSRATWEFRNFFSNSIGTINNYVFNAHALITRMAEKPSEQRQDLVVISSPFFPHRLMSGYDNRFGSVLLSVNDRPVKSLEHLVTMLRDHKEELVILKFDQEGAESIVLPHQQIVAATESILQDNGIRQLASSELLEIWNKK